ncbi:hypothetical protein MMC28_009718, partial [Mycoblastus sanguinarius]|nr:hypothetical protein [Mycoblastus sanguinarius]
MSSPKPLVPLSPLSPATVAATEAGAKDRGDEGLSTQAQSRSPQASCPNSDTRQNGDTIAVQLAKDKAKANLVELRDKFFRKNFLILSDYLFEQLLPIHMPLSPESRIMFSQYIDKWSQARLAELLDLGISQKVIYARLGAKARSTFAGVSFYPSEIASVEGTLAKTNITAQEAAKITFLLEGMDFTTQQVEEIKKIFVGLDITAQEAEEIKSYLLASIGVTAQRAEELKNKITYLGVGAECAEKLKKINACSRHTALEAETMKSVLGINNILILPEGSSLVDKKSDNRPIPQPSAAETPRPDAS